MRFARIVEGLVTDVCDVDPAGIYHPAIAAEFEPVSGAVNVGDRQDGDAFIPADPTPTDPAYVPVQLALIDFLRLFTTNELAGFNALRKACQALSAADYQAAAEGDQGKAALVGFEVFLTFYDALRAGLIELNNDQTIEGLSLLVPLGVLTAPRLAQVLAGDLPA